MIESSCVVAQRQEAYYFYLFITYIEISKPHLISVAAGVVHMVNLLKGY